MGHADLTMAVVDLRLVITRSFPLPPEVLNVMQAMADAGRSTLEKELLQWFDDYLEGEKGRDEDLVTEAIQSWKGNQWLNASWVLSTALSLYGEWELYDTEEEFREQQRNFLDSDDGTVLPPECRQEFDKAVACALELNGKDCRRHVRAAVRYWWKDDHPVED